MNRKFIHGLLLLTVATGGVGTFTSCKDNEEDFRNEVLANQKNLSEEIASLRGYIDSDFYAKIGKEIDAKIAAALAAGDFATVKQLNDVKSALEGSINALASTVSALESTMNGKIDALDSKMAADLAALRTELVGMLEGEVGKLNEALAACQAYCENEFNQVYQQLDQLTQTLSSVYDLAAEAQAAAAAALENSEEAKAAAAAATEAAAKAQEDAAKALGEAAANKAAIDALQANVDDLLERLGNVEGDVTTLKDDLEQQKNDLNELQREQAEMLATLGSLANLMTEMQDDLNNALNDINEILIDLYNVQNQIDDLNNRVDGLFDYLVYKLNHLITSININQTNNPLFGTINLPIGLNTMILGNYYAYADHAMQFPYSMSTYEYWNSNPANMEFNIDLLKPERTDYEANTYYFDEMDNTLGDIYVTVNPVNVNFNNVKMQLVNSLDKQVLSDLTLVKDNETELTFGTNLSRANNGFYRLPVKAEAKDVNDIQFVIEPGLKSAFKEILKDRSLGDFKADIPELAKVIYRQFDGILPAYALKVSWDDLDENGEPVRNAVISDYEVAATTFHPLSYKTAWGFTVNHQLPNFDPITEYFSRFWNDLRNDINIDLGELGGFKHISINFDEVDTDINMENIVIDLGGIEVRGDGYDENGVWQTDMVIGVIPAGTTITLTTNPDGTISGVVGDLSNLTTAISNVIGNVNEQFEKIKNSLQTQVNDMIDEMNKQLEGLQANINGQIDDILNKIYNNLHGKLHYADKLVDLYNKLANRINKALKDPNHYLQVMMAYNNGDGLGHLSTNIHRPTIFKGNGQAIELYMTSYNAELIVPSFKKYVAINRVFDEKGNDVTSSVDLRALNAQSQYLNKVISGRQQRNFINAASLKTGYTYEIYYSAMDFRGFTSSRMYYIRKN